MNKKELAYFLADKYDIKKGLSEDIIESLFLKVEQELRKKKRVNIVGFGSFYTKEMKKRTATNPQNGETFELESRTIVKFKLGKKLSDMFKKK
jgi:DNA-binding protein HU-beta